jgi:hypothetical protein
MMYSLWASKPLDIKEPTLVSADGFKDELALMVMRSPGYIREPHRVVKYPSFYKPAWTIKPFWRRWPGSMTTEASYVAFNPNSMAERPKSILHFRKCDNVQHDSLGPVIKWIRRNEYFRFASPAANGEISEDQINESVPEGCILPAIPNACPEPVHRFSVEPPPSVETIGSLRSGEFLATGFGVSVFVTGKKKKSFFGKGHSTNSSGNEVQPITDYSEDHELGEFRDTVPCRASDRTHLMTVTLSEKDLVRWNRAAAAFSRDLKQVPETISGDRFLGLEDKRSALGNYFVENRALNLRLADFTTLWPKDLDHDPATTISIVMMSLSLLLLGMMYGGIHLALWKYPFAPYAEKILWQVSAIDLLALPFTTGLVSISLSVVGVIVVRKERSSWKKHIARVNERRGIEKAGTKGKRRKLPKWVKIARQSVIRASRWVVVLVLLVVFIVLLPFLLGVVGGLLIYIPARVYVVVESFLSIRHVPMGVYKASTWANYIPHL